MTGFLWWLGFAASVASLIGGGWLIAYFAHRRHVEGVIVGTMIACVAFAGMAVTTAHAVKVCSDNTTSRDGGC